MHLILDERGREGIKQQTKRVLAGLARNFLETAADHIPYRLLGAEGQRVRL